MIARRLVLLAFAVMLGAAHAIGGETQSTKVSAFTPAIPVGRSRSGHCWTDSIAVRRRGAYRCMIGNEIYDPCFTNLNLSGAVICGANPASGEKGFILKLTKRLPKPSGHQPSHPRPWLVKLADGTTCEIQTGTTAFVAGVVVPYGCSDSQKCDDSGCPYMTGLTEDFKQGKVWMADKVSFSSSANGLKLLSRNQVPVAAVWK
jgi:hypothetical protein